MTNATDEHLVKLLTADLNAADWQLQGALRDHAAWRRIVRIATLLVPIVVFANWALLRIPWMELAGAVAGGYLFVVGVFLSFRWLVGRRIVEMWKRVADLERAGRVVYRQQAGGLYDFGLRVGSSLPAQCVQLTSHRPPSVAECVGGARQDP